MEGRRVDADTLLGLLYEQCEEQALILLDGDGIVVAWMMGAAKIFGRSAEEMRGRTAHCLFTAEDQKAKVPEGELIAARSGVVSEDDRWMVRSDGSRFWANGFVIRLRAADGTVVGFSKLLRDRTDTRAQVEALRNRVALLSEEDRRKLVMFGTLAHELRNPLAAVVNAVHLIDLAYPNDAKLSYALQVLKRQTDYIGALIGDLLDVARVRTGKSVLQYNEIEVRELLADVVESMRPDLDRKEQLVKLVPPPMPIRLDGDVVRLRQVFINLLQNASKYSPHRGQIVVMWTDEADEVVIKVEDNGEGIPAQLQPFIFDLLTQATPAEGVPPQGLGLGLSLAKDYVELHGGSVQVRSDGVGKGSEFTVRLPRKRPTRVQGAADERTHAP
jgi:two-component system CheB/CheR fusion protein